MIPSIERWVAEQKELSRSAADVVQTEEIALRTEGGPIEGTNISLFNTIIPSFWAENGLSTSSSWVPGGAQLAEQVWVANRCQQMNAQQIASMPVLFHATDGVDEPAWVSSPDPHMFPNGIGDALHAIVDQLYGWGFSCQYVTDFYASGWPRTWTVLPSASLDIRWVNGSREYRVGEEILNASRIVQIDRNPTTAARGCSALRAYSQVAWGLLAAGNQSMNVSQGGVPQVVLKSQRKLNAEQAAALQAQWMTAVQARNGAPPVLPPELDFVPLSFDPSDLSLLETQQWNAQVIATAYGVPAPALNMALQGGLTYQNPMSLMQGWWLTELRTTATRIMNAFSNQMLPGKQLVSLDASDFTAGLAGEPDAADDEQRAHGNPDANPTPAPARLSAVGT